MTVPTTFSAVLKSSSCKSALFGNLLRVVKLSELLLPSCHSSSFNEFRIYEANFGCDAPKLAAFDKRSRPLDCAKKYWYSVVEIYSLLVLSVTTCHIFASLSPRCAAADNKTQGWRRMPCFCIYKANEARKKRAFALRHGVQAWEEKGRDWNGPWKKAVVTV